MVPAIGSFLLNAFSFQPFHLSFSPKYIAGR